MRFDHRNVGLHLERLRYLADLKNNVNDRIAVHPQNNSGLNVCRKPWKARLKTVRTDRQIGQGVRACLIGNRRAVYARVGLYDFNFNTGKDRSRRVLDCS